MTLRRVGLLGGTFDPIHCGHIDAARAAESALGLTEVHVIPAHVPPHRPQPAASSYHRFAMAALAVAGRTGWRVSDVELLHDGPSFTTTTLARLHDRGYASTELVFIVGADAFAEIETWKDFPAIFEGAHFAVVSRPGAAVGDLPRRLPALASRMLRVSRVAVASGGPSIFLIDAPTADVSSTTIRRRRASGESIAGLVPPPVQQHIEQHGLYLTPTPDSDAGAAHHERAAGRLHGKN